MLRLLSITIGSDSIHAEKPSRIDEMSSCEPELRLLHSYCHHVQAKDPMDVEPSLCPSEFQALAEPEPLEADVSNRVTRAARLLTICSIFVIYASYEATVFESWMRVTDNERCRTHRNGKPQKRAPRPARRRDSREAKRRPSHIGRTGLRDDLL